MKFFHFSYLLLTFCLCHACNSTQKKQNETNDNLNVVPLKLDYKSDKDFFYKNILEAPESVYEYLINSNNLYQIYNNYDIVIVDLDLEGTIVYSADEISYKFDETGKAVSTIERQIGQLSKQFLGYDIRMFDFIDEDVFSETDDNQENNLLISFRINIERLCGNVSN